MDKDLEKRIQTLAQWFYESKYPVVFMPREAILSGAKLVIINQGETPFDHLVSLRFHESIGDVLPKAVKKLKRLMGFFE